MALPKLYLLVTLHLISSFLLHLIIVGLQLHMWTWCGGIPDSSRRCQTTSTLRFPNNNSPHFAPNLRHIYSFNLSSQILRLSGSRPRHSCGMTPGRITEKSPKVSEQGVLGHCSLRGGERIRGAQKISLEEGKPDPVTTEVVQSAEIRQRWFQ